MLYPFVVVWRELYLSENLIKKSIEVYLIETFLVFATHYK